jgi:protein-S-isoprenylcysteine O-methyltransferase Ste14
MRLFLWVKISVFTALVPGTVILYIPYRLLAKPGAFFPFAPLALALPAALCLLAGVAVYLRCAWDFAVFGQGTPAPLDPPKRLVVAGLYRWTRNPMYLGVLLALLAEALGFLSLGLLAYAGVVAAIFHAFIVLYEEPNLRKRFGSAYTAYCQAIPRWGVALHPFAAKTI